MIDKLLQEIREDKDQNPSTTSFKFKTDLWEFFNRFEFKELNACEFGTHKGQTTRILSHLFNHVYTFNLHGHFDEAERLNSDRANITYIPINLYSEPVEKPIRGIGQYPMSVFLIDAIHDFDSVIRDFSRAVWLPHADGDVYFIFDDYGLYREVYQAVNQLIVTGRIERVAYIGHPPRHTFAGGRVLDDYEGIICKLKS